MATQLPNWAALVMSGCLIGWQCIASGATEQPLTQPVAPLCNWMPVA